MIMFVYIWVNLLESFAVCEIRYFSVNLDSELVNVCQHHSEHGALPISVYEYTNGHNAKYFPAVVSSVSIKILVLQILKQIPKNRKEDNSRLCVFPSTYIM